MKNKELKLEIVYVPMEHLIASEYNPRKISNKQIEELKTSIKEYGMVEPIIINGSKERYGIIISGHQRFRLLQELGYTEAPCNVLNLSLKKEKELNIRMNKNGGSFDHMLLSEFFERNELLDWGFLEIELPEIVVTETMKMPGDDEPVYPIVPEFSENYNYVVIIATNEIDTAYLDNFFDVEMEHSYKNSRVAVGRVVTFEKFKKLVQDERVG